MSWDQAYRQLRQQLSREPNSREVQQRMWELAAQKTEKANTSARPHSNPALGPQ